MQRNGKKNRHGKRITENTETSIDKRQKIRVPRALLSVTVNTSFLNPGPLTYEPMSNYTALAELRRSRNENPLISTGCSREN